MKIPSSWYYCVESSEVPTGEVVGKELFGHRLVFWRTESGVLHVSDATCPHRGSDLSKLGSVCGEHLKCFSHDYEYDSEGSCVKTWANTLPCRADKVLYSWPVHEVGGFVLVWYDAYRREPTWQIPDDIFSSEGKGSFIRSQYVFDCPIETINEDNFDVGHLYKWHELTEVSSTLPKVDGTTISVVHDFKRHSILFSKPLPPPLDVLSKEITSRYGSTLYGHGLTYSYIDLPVFDFHVQDFIFATPLGNNRTLYTTFLRRVLPEGKRSLQERFVDTVIHPVMFAMFVMRLRQEHKNEGHGFWENQSRVEAPIITERERPMLEPYWQWCRQFDPDASLTKVARLPIVSKASA